MLGRRKADPPALGKMTTKCKGKNNTETAGGWGSGDSGEREAGAELGGGFAMAEEAEGAEVVEVALATAFGYGANVVGIPQAAASRATSRPIAP